MFEEDLQDYAAEFGTPLIVFDHAILRSNYRLFTSSMPRVEPFFAVKANPETAIIRTLQKEGAGFDVASWEEFMMVYNTITEEDMEKKEFMETKTVYANPVKKIDSLRTLNAFDLYMTFDNFVELDKIAKYCADAHLIIRVNVPNTGSVVELSTKFGADPNIAMDLIKYARTLDLDVCGVSFHVGSQCISVENYINAFKISRKIFDEAKEFGLNLSILDIGGGFPAPYDSKVLPFSDFANAINAQIDMLFADPEIRIIAEPGRFLVATCATAISEVNGITTRNGTKFYYINDGVYNTFSGVIFDHIQYHFKSFKDGPLFPSTVAGPTCDALDKVVVDDQLPDLELGDLIYAENVGAYTNASATYFNGFPPAKIHHINQE